MARIIPVGLLLASCFTLAGCDHYFMIQGRAVEAGDSSFEFMDSRAEFEKRVASHPRLTNLRFRLFKETYDGPVETKLWKYSPVDRENGDSVAVWMTGWPSPTWTHLIVECEGFVPVEIPREFLPESGSRKYLLIALKKTP